MSTTYSPHPPACPVCPGRGMVLGQLGRLRWYRCRDCGIDFSRRAPPARRAAGLANPGSAT